MGGCGQPCATEPLMIHELLSLGGDVFEQSVPEEERHPKPPELSKEQEKAFKDSIKELKPKERAEREKTFKEERATVVQRQALVARHKYVVSRLHYRYDAKTLPNDPKLGAGAPASGGTDQPKGKDGAASTEIKMGGENKLQTRYTNFHTWVPVIACPSPDRYRWGKAGRDYRGLRKTWIADDLTRKSHTQIKPAVVVKTAISELGLGLAPAPEKPDAGAQTGAGSDPTSGKCSCRVPGAGGNGSSVAAAFAWLLLAMLSVRRRLCGWGSSQRRD